MEIKVIGEANTWDDLLKMCGSLQVIYLRNDKDGYPLYASVCGDVIGEYAIKFTGTK